MKINEISIPKNITSKYSSYLTQAKRTPVFSEVERYKFSRFLSKLGWKERSYGKFSTVYINPNKSYVLKVNNIFDPGYQRYIDFISKHKNNKYLPKIISKELITKSHEKYYLYFIEKLKYFPKTVVTEFISAIAERTLSNDLTDIINALSDSDKKIVNKINKKYPGLLRTAFEIGKNTGRKNLDIHNKNVMQRADGTPVITDPYAE